MTNMPQNISSILKQVLERVTPNKEELESYDKIIDLFLGKIKNKIEKLKIDADSFVGGSFAKKTVIKKDHYDIDLFIIFNRKYKEKDISNMTEKILKEFQNAVKVHGSRDYFHIKIRNDFFIEIIPVLKVEKIDETENITDLSFSHVKYINKKTKNKKLLDEIRLAKAFCYANGTYGAESYISGFSGYALELLVIHYKSFLNFIKAISKNKEDKIVIDIEKSYKNKREILMDISSAKLNSPIILIDPTYKKRNALAALSNETYERFKKASIDFIKNPSIESFEVKKTDLEKVKENAKKKDYEFILIETKTDRQEGDIAGSKLLKFYRHLNEEITKFFEVNNHGFNYNKKKAARFYFIVKAKKDILINGPYINDKKNVKIFEKKHKNYFTKKGRIYSKDKVDFSIEEFIDRWKKKNSKKIKEMDIISLEVIEN